VIAVLIANKLFLSDSYTNSLSKELYWYTNVINDIIDTLHIVAVAGESTCHIALKFELEIS